MWGVPRQLGTSVWDPHPWNPQNPPGGEPGALPSWQPLPSWGIGGTNTPLNTLPVIDGSCDDASDDTFDDSCDDSCDKFFSRRVTGASVLPDSWVVGGG